jgi:hypothetical protein
MLCDLGAADLVFPRRWFVADSRGIDSAAGIVQLAAIYQASREAAIRRFAELHDDAAAALFLSWKLKPTEQGRVGRSDQANMFGITPQEETRDAIRLRVDYAIVSESFAESGRFVPRDKSLESEGPVYRAALSGQPVDGEGPLDLGPAKGMYRINAIPLWTPNDERGPKGENAVGAIIKPVGVRQQKRKDVSAGPGLFG